MCSKLIFDYIRDGSSTDILRVRMYEGDERLFYFTLFKSGGRKFVRVQNCFTLGESNVFFGEGFDMPLWNWEAFMERLPRIQEAVERNSTARFDINSNLFAIVEFQFNRLYLFLQKRVTAPQSLHTCFVVMRAESVAMLNIVNSAFQTV